MQVDLDNVTFVSNDQPRSVMEKTTAAPQQVQESLRVNIEARLHGLKIAPLFRSLTTLAPLAAGRHAAHPIPLAPN